MSIIGIVMSIIVILIKTTTFTIFAITQAIIYNDVDTKVRYTIPLIILLISTTILACVIVL